MRKERKLGPLREEGTRKARIFERDRDEEGAEN